MRTVSARSIAVVMMGAFALLGAAGCASSDDSPTKLTEQDYQRAVDAQAACVEKGNVHLTDQGWSPVSQNTILIVYNAPDVTSDQRNQVVDECRDKNLEAITERYEAENPPRMKPDLMARIRTCLDLHGIIVSADLVNAHDLLKAVPTDKLDVLVDCVNSETFALYPTLTAVSFP